jgi:hypothetical protein
VTLADNGDGTRSKRSKNPVFTAHQLEHLGIPGSRVRVSRKWSNKTLNVSLCTHNFKLWAVAHPLTSYRKVGFSTLVRYKKVGSSPFLA